MRVLKPGDLVVLRIVENENILSTEAAIGCGVGLVVHVMEPGTVRPHEYNAAVMWSGPDPPDGALDTKLREEWLQAV